MHRYRRGFSKLKELYKTFFKKNIYIHVYASIKYGSRGPAMKLKIWESH